MISDGVTCTYDKMTCVGAGLILTTPHWRLFWGLQEQIGAIERLTQKTMQNSAIDKSGIKTFEGKLGINPAFGGSSGIMTGAK